MKEYLRFLKLRNKKLKKQQTLGENKFFSLIRNMECHHLIMEHHLEIEFK